MPDADLDRIISELRRKREQLTDVIERLVVRREDDATDGEAGAAPTEPVASREEPPPRV